MGNWAADRVDLSNIRMPVLNVYAKDDHIIPPATSRALGPMLGASSDYTELAFRADMWRLRRRPVAGAVRARCRLVCGKA